MSLMFALRETIDGFKCMCLIFSKYRPPKQHQTAQIRQNFRIVRLLLCCFFCEAQSICNVRWVQILNCCGQSQWNVIRNTVMKQELFHSISIAVSDTCFHFKKKENNSHRIVIIHQKFRLQFVLSHNLSFVSRSHEPEFSIHCARFPCQQKLFIFILSTIAPIFQGW